jgi:tRNA A-37 threonylcarbamoyl transferase component Bud32
MGALYLAADTGTFDRRCVVKELLDYYDPTDPEEARQAQGRFETEARLLAELSHPGIPRIYSYFTEAGRHYIVMEYIEGETLEQAVTHVDPLGRTVAARPLPAEEVVRHAIRVCHVLEYLSAQPTPVVHHDVKPANLIVDGASGEVRLVDFGTARIRTPWATRTRLEWGEAAIFGTEGYAAPEHHQGQSDPRSDVYALAATTYHLLTDDDPGDHPFHFPRLETLPGPLADALSQALHLELGRRCSARAFRQALETWLIPEDAAHPFVFGSGALARTTGELVALSDLHWPEARRHLLEGDFERWFRARSRHDLVARARAARQEEDADAALEAFLQRLDPRLPPPRLAVEPQAFDYGRVSRAAPAVRRLEVRNQGRGYARLRFEASVPWLRIEPRRAGCLAGAGIEVDVHLDPAGLSLRRDHQAIVTVTPARGAPLSIPVAARLDLGQEFLARLTAWLRPTAGAALQGARQGFFRWRRAFFSLARSRAGAAVLLVETLLLAGLIATLRQIWQGGAFDLGDWLVSYFPALLLAFVAAHLLPAVVLVAGVALWQAARALMLERHNR